MCTTRLKITDFQFLILELEFEYKPNQSKCALILEIETTIIITA